MPTYMPESFAYRHKLAHRAWLNKTAIYGMPQPDNISDLVWELMMLYTDSTRNFDSVRDDIYVIATEIAEQTLDKMKTDQVLRFYRDMVIETIIQFTNDEHASDLVKFSNVLSDAITEASTTRLKRLMLARNAQSQSNELRLAKAIQHTLLPKSIPQIPGFEFAGRLLPAEDVGGDYWSIKHHNSTGIITLKLADISGHGIAAATLVAAVKFISGGYYSGAVSASEVMRKTNRVLTRETPHEILVSMVYGWLNPNTKKLTLVNAGLEPVFACTKTQCIDIVPTGPVMGFTEDAEYDETHIQLSEGDVVFFGSDGITEAGIGELFGMKRLKEVVLSNSHLSASEIADLVIKTVKDYAGETRDDISLLVLKVTDDKSESLSDGI